MTDKKYMIQDYSAVTPDALLSAVRDLKGEGYRLVQICGTLKEDGIEVMYSFDKDHIAKNLKVLLAQDEKIESISGEYWPAFIYENEVHDLFGITFKHLALDFGGKFYKITEPTPWNPKN
jgi:ech hydrogenase subunit D